jgi:hypothetical protein
MRQTGFHIAPGTENQVRSSKTFTTHIYVVEILLFSGSLKNHWTLLPGVGFESLSKSISEL